MSPCSFECFLLQYVVHPPHAAFCCFFSAIYGSDVCVLFYCTTATAILVCVPFASQFLPLSLSFSLYVLLLGDRLLLVPLVVFSQFFSPFSFVSARLTAAFCVPFFPHFSFITPAIFSDNSGLSPPFPVPPTTCISSATFSFSSPSLLRLFLRPQDVRRCPVGPEVKPRLSTSHPTRHFDSSISSLCVVCVVLSVSRPA